MSVSGISSTSFMNPNTAHSKSQLQSQQWQIQNPFQSLAQQFQTGSLAAEQALPQSPLATPQNPSASGTIAVAGSSASSASAPAATGTVATPGSSTQSNTQQAHGHSHHRRHLSVAGGPETDGATAATSTHGQLGQAIQASSSSSAQQAYGSVEQGLQSALNSDLITAQSAALEASSISLTM